jgi:hypothetical protein
MPTRAENLVVLDRFMAADKRVVSTSQKTPSQGLASPSNSGWKSRLPILEGQTILSENTINHGQQMTERCVDEFYTILSVVVVSSSRARHYLLAIPI